MDQRRAEGGGDKEVKRGCPEQREYFLEHGQRADVLVFNLTDLIGKRRKLKEYFNTILTPFYQRHDGFTGQVDVLLLFQFEPPFSFEEEKVKKFIKEIVDFLSSLMKQKTINCRFDRIGFVKEIQSILPKQTEVYNKPEYLYKAGGLVLFCKSPENDSYNNLPLGEEDFFVRVMHGRNLDADHKKENLYKYFNRLTAFQLEEAAIDGRLALIALANTEPSDFPFRQIPLAKDFSLSSADFLFCTDLSREYTKFTHLSLFLSEVNKETDFEKKKKSIVLALKALSDCISAAIYLAARDLFVLDIKPDNIGIGINSEQVSEGVLFDLTYIVRGEKPIFARPVNVEHFKKKQGKYLPEQFLEMYDRVSWELVGFSAVEEFTDKEKLKIFFEQKTSELPKPGEAELVLSFGLCLEKIFETMLEFCSEQVSDNDINRVEKITAGKVKTLQKVKFFIDEFIKGVE